MDFYGLMPMDRSVSTIELTILTYIGWTITLLQSVLFIKLILFCCGHFKHKFPYFRG